MECVDIGLACLISWANIFQMPKTDGIINSHVGEGYYSKQTNIIYYNHQEFLIMISL